jgi:hypothetical protein
MTDEVLFKHVCSLNSKIIREKYKYLGEGISREVYAINEDFVVKVAKGNEGIYQNRIENHVYTHVDKNLLKYLCPISWFQPNRLIMRRAIPLSKFNKNQFIDINSLRPEKELSADLRRLANSFLLFYEDIISVSSWGIYKNEQVLIDYGCTEKTGDVFYRVFYNW